MDLGLTEEQAALVDSFGALLSKSSSPERVRAAEPQGFDPDLWRTLTDTGVVVMALPEPDGGWGAQLLDLVLVAEQLGRSMAAAPVIEAQVAARLLARSGAAPEAVAAVVEGSSLTTLAVHPARDGVCDLVPGGAVSDRLVPGGGASARGRCHRRRRRTSAGPQGRLERAARRCALA